METRGHITNTGLRGHSVGEIYPYMVVGIGNPHKPMAFRWAVQNPRGRILPARFMDSQEAEDNAALMKRLFID